MMLNNSVTPCPVKIGYYEIEAMIGKGNFGLVKLASHTITKSKVAIKIIDKTRLNKDNLHKVNREIAAMKQLEHPHIIKLYQVIESTRMIYIVTEYASGGEIFDHLLAHGRLSEKEARLKFMQVASALSYCHSRNIVHRDVKPENLLLDAARNIKLADFGFTNTFAESQLLSTWCGSLPYAAPELFEGKKYDGPKVDVWSLGVVLYVMVCSALPFDGNTIAELKARVLSCRYYVPFYLSPECKDLLNNMLIVADRRYDMLDVINHRWVRHPQTAREYEAMMAQIRDFAPNLLRRQRGADNPPVAAPSPNCDVTLNSVVLDHMANTFKFDRQVVVNSVLNRKFNDHAAIYQLFCDKLRKLCGTSSALQTPLSALEHLSPPPNDCLELLQPQVALQHEVDKSASEAAAAKTSVAMQTPQRPHTLPITCAPNCSVCDDVTLQVCACQLMEEEETEQPSPEAIARYNSVRRHTFATNTSANAGVNSSSSTISASNVPSDAASTSSASDCADAQAAALSSHRSASTFRRELRRLPAVIPEHCTPSSTEPLMHESAHVRSSDRSPSAPLHDLMELSVDVDASQRFVSVARPAPDAADPVTKTLAAEVVQLDVADCRGSESLSHPCALCNTTPCARVATRPHLHHPYNRPYPLHRYDEPYSHVLGRSSQYAATQSLVVNTGESDCAFSAALSASASPNAAGDSRSFYSPRSNTMVAKLPVPPCSPTLKRSIDVCCCADCCASRTCTQSFDAADDGQRSNVAGHKFTLARRSSDTSAMSAHCRAQTLTTSAASRPSSGNASTHELLAPGASLHEVRLEYARLQLQIARRDSNSLERQRTTEPSNRKLFAVSSDAEQAQGRLTGADCPASQAAGVNAIDINAQSTPTDCADGVRRIEDSSSMTPTAGVSLAAPTARSIIPPSFLFTTHSPTCSSSRGSTPRIELTLALPDSTLRPAVLGSTLLSPSTTTTSSGIMLSCNSSLLTTPSPSFSRYSQFSAADSGVSPDLVSPHAAWPTTAWNSRSATRTHSHISTLDRDRASDVMSNSYTSALSPCSIDGSHLASATSTTQGRFLGLPTCYPLTLRRSSSPADILSPDKASGSSVLSAVPTGDAGGALFVPSACASGTKYADGIQSTCMYGRSFAGAREEDDEEELRTIERANQEVRRQVISKSLTSGNLEANLFSANSNSAI